MYENITVKPLYRLTKIELKNSHSSSLSLCVRQMHFESQLCHVLAVHLYKWFDLSQPQLLSHL
jgi:hypothetical protein